MSQQINLFNPIFLKQKKHFSAVTMAQALGLILLGSLLLTGYLNYRTMVLKKEAAALDAQLVAAEAQLKQITESAKLKQKNATLELGVKKTEAELAMLHRVFDTLNKGDIGNTKGYSEYFKAFARQIIPGVWLTGLTIHGAGSDMGIRGGTLAPDLVPDYLGRLKREPAMKGASFTTLEMHVPSVEQQSSAGQQAPKQGQANYIEFNLRSAGLQQDNAARPGADRK